MLIIIIDNRVAFPLERGFRSYDAYFWRVLRINVSLRGLMKFTFYNRLVMFTLQASKTRIWARKELFIFRASHIHQSIAIHETNHMRVGQPTGASGVHVVCVAPKRVRNHVKVHQWH